MTKREMRETIHWPTIREYFARLPKDAQKRVLARATPDLRRRLTT